MIPSTQRQLHAHAQRLRQMCRRQAQILRRTPYDTAARRLLREGWILLETVRKARKELDELRARMQQRKTKERQVTPWSEPSNCAMTTSP